MAKARAAATKAPVVKAVDKGTPRPIVKPAAAPTSAVVVTTKTPAEDRRWRLLGAIIVAVGLLGASFAATRGGLDTVQATPLAAVGQVITDAAFWVHLAGLAMALGGIGLGIIASNQRVMEGAVHRIHRWALGALATAWVVAGMVMSLSADLASEWGHGAGAKAAFATGNIITGAPAALLLAMVSITAVVAWRQERRVVAPILSALIAFTAVALVVAEVNDLAQAAGAVALLTVLWVGVAALPPMRRA